jgi:hypothetical protein
MPLLAPEYVIIISLGLILVCWYYVTTILSRRFSRKIYLWLKQDLAALGNPASAQATWLNGSIHAGGRISLARPHAPFEQHEIIYVLQSRSLLPVWVANLWRRQRNLLVFQGRLRKQPGFELEILPVDNQAVHSLRQETTNPWRFTDGPHNLVIARRGHTGHQPERLRPFLDKYGLILKRLSWSPKDPHVLIALQLTNLPAEEAAVLFQAVRKAISG